MCELGNQFIKIFDLSIDKMMEHLALVVKANKNVTERLKAKMIWDAIAQNRQGLLIAHPFRNFWEKPSKKTQDAVVHFSNKLREM
jgi:hypothetical protein